MSKNKNYTDYYKKPEEPKEEVKDEPVQEPEEDVTPEEEETPVVQEETKEVKQEAVTEYAVVWNAKAVNFREAPNKDSKVLKVLPVGTKVIIRDKLGDWTRIMFGNQEGYMMTKFLKPVPFVVKGN